jgi:2,5-diketo-D-gluconate reductase A
MTSEDYAEPAVELANGRMPLLGFGTWQISKSDASQATAVAVEAGYRHIETATLSRNESGIGKALAASSLPRDAIFLTTKLPPDHVGRERRTLEASLRMLGVDYVDLWLIHWPPNGRAAPHAWARLVEAQRDGLTRDIGVSNYSLSQIDELIAVTGVTPAVNQIRWGPPLYDQSVVAGLEQRGIVLEGYSPFKVTNLKDQRLVAIAAKHEATTAQIIVAWHIGHGYVVIPKSVHRERIIANAAGVRIELSADEIADIDGFTQQKTARRFWG